MNNSHDQVDPYQAPSAEITPASPSSSAPFYLVSPAKFSLLFWSTMGIYDLYWQYKNWALYREARGGGGLPVLRALFSIFFAPSLFHHIAREARAAGVPGTFRPSALAVVYMLGTLFSTVGNNLIDQPSLAGLLLWLGGWWCCCRCGGLCGVVRNASTPRSATKPVSPTVVLPGRMRYGSGSAVCCG
ncbi:hypothetical protein [Alloalcanivorax marinus]|uniref:hypothetical protein n=1 Tax=Alloalcanivorax marinus TaxID=1177169 RepID=UPI001958E1FF|nr:hypothetical protein [Alloalcanivorax marinus]MBM7335462.1 hypothetical protein [Alloalcanivorax marinus]